MTIAVDIATDIRPFQLKIPQDQIDDLRRRIAATRWPTKELVEDRSQGVQLATTKELARFWATDYDLGRIEARLNALPQFKTEIDGVEIHFIHVKSRHENALPLIMTHGWPGSIIELLETVGPLTDPTAHGGTAEDAFHLVLPSLPGYGLSAEPAELGWDAARTGRAWAELMHRLGYTRYVAQGGDVGALVTDLMGRQAVEGLVGYHLNLLTAVLAIGDHLPKISEEERVAADAVAKFRQDGFGYFLEMATRPQTIGYAMLDSPVALAAWLLDHDTDSYYKIAGAFVDGKTDGQPHPGEYRRQHHAVLVDRHRRPRRPASYWEDGRALAAALASGQPPRRSRFRSASRRSRARSGRRHEAGSRRSTPTSRTSTRPTRAGTSPRGRSRSSSPKNCERPSALCADPPRPFLCASSAGPRAGQPKLRRWPECFTNRMESESLEPVSIEGLRQ